MRCETCTIECDRGILKKKSIGNMRQVNVTLACWLIPRTMVLGRTASSLIDHSSTVLSLWILHALHTAERADCSETSAAAIAPVWICSETLIVLCIVQGDTARKNVDLVIPE